MEIEFESFAVTRSRGGQFICWPAFHVIFKLAHRHSFYIRKLHIVSQLTADDIFALSVCLITFD